MVLLLCVCALLCAHMSAGALVFCHWLQSAAVP